MIKYAITGTFGAGKSKVSSLIRTYGYDVLDSDACVKSYYLPSSSIYGVIKTCLKDYPVFVEDRIDLKRLSDVYFVNKALKEKLNQILYAQLTADICLFQQNHDISFVEVPLLFETGFDKLFDQVIVVDCLPQIAVKRLQQFRSIDEQTYTTRMNQQYSREYKLAHADIIIENNGDEETLERKVNQWLNQLQSN